MRRLWWLFAVLAWACDDAEGDAGACVPGETQVCACDDGRAGAQVCGESGEGWLACACAEGPSTPRPDAMLADDPRVDTGAPDAAVPDAAMLDGAAPDAAEIDAGRSDAATVDAARADAGGPDATHLDAAPPDGAFAEDAAVDGQTADAAPPGECAPGATRPCGLGVGVCVLAIQTCEPDATWGACPGFARQQDEVCDGADNDCDGLTDEGVQNACGGCGVAPREICDGLDNDCDGAADEDVRNACGGCGPVPNEVCDGIDNDCDGAADEQVRNACGGCGPVPRDVCDGIDNDCDGSADEGVVNACGVCGVVPPEVCDGVDNDCDGDTDEGVQNACGGCGSPAEVCNDRDDDCDGTADEGFPDDDGDGQADCADVDGDDDDVPDLEDNCPRDANGDQADLDRDGQGDVCDADDDGDRFPDVVDCAPGDAAINPGAIELCNGVDDNCNRVTDEFLEQACYDGPEGSAGLGQCRSGRRRCEAGAWGACLEQVLPGDEACNARDDDCDGRSDEALTRACYQGPPGTRGVGECAAGAQACVQGDWGFCEGQVLPSLEACDGSDEDCDGEADEDLVQVCWPGPAAARDVGACSDGVSRCVDGAFGGCEGAVLPVAELCDGADLDCDGAADEDFPDLDGDGAADCVDPDDDGDGVPDLADVCPAVADRSQADLDGDGLGDACDDDVDGDGVVPPADCAPRDATRFEGAAERCDNLDQDCDGSVDEALERGCYPGPAGTRGVGACADGREVCAAGEWGPCLEASLPAPEACDGADEDCDGLVDEALVAACYSGPEGTEGVGACAGGGAVCAEGVFGACEGEVVPAAEVCNQIDDDCDGMADEALDCVCPAAHTTIDSQADVDALNASGCNEVGGSLVVNPGAPAVVRLPNIVRVVNNVILFGTTERVELPALREIGSELQILGDFLFHVALPELEVAESIYVDSLDLIELVLPRLRLSATVWVERSGLVRIALPVLSAGHTVRIVSNPNLATLDLPLLESASSIDLSGNHLLRVLEFPALVRVWEDFQIGSNDGLRRLAAPLLVTAAGNRSVTLTMNPLLDEIEFPSYVGPPIVVVFNEGWPQCLRPAAFPLLDLEGSDIRGNRIDCVCDVVDGELVATCPD